MKNNDVLKRLTAGGTLVAFIGSGVWAIEARYAKAADVRELRHEIRGQGDELKLVILEDRLYQIKVTQRVRKLTDLEAERQAELEREVEALKLRIRTPRP